MSFLVEGIISVELKAKSTLEDVHFAQAINYLEAYNLEVGLLINFGEISLNFKRLSNKKFTSIIKSNQSYLRQQYINKWVRREISLNSDFCD